MGIMSQSIEGEQGNNPLKFFDFGSGQSFLRNTEPVRAGIYRLAGKSYALSEIQGR